jgi:glycosyltransferase involved in cell wall biosynthesis
MLVRELDTPDRHEIVTLFTGETDNLEAHHRLAVRSGWMRRLGFDLRVPLKLGRTFRRVSPRLIVAHGGEALKYAVMAGRGDSGLVYVRIGISSAKAQRRLRRTFQQLLLRRPDRIVAVSGAVRDELVAGYELDPETITVIPNARDERLFAPPDSRDQRDPATLIFIGHMTATKRPDEFVKMVSSLRGRGARLNARMVGDGPLLADMAALGEQSGVEVLGRRDDVAALLRGADIFVFTSVSEGEGMPGVLIEAALSGLPIVTTDVPGARDVVDDGLSGFVVAEDDPDGMMSRVERLVSDAQLRTRMGREARAKAVKRFTPDVTKRLWSDVLVSLSDPTS